MFSERLLRFRTLRRRLVHRGARAGTLVLDPRHVYILPSRAGYGFALMLLVMLIGAINYNNSLGFMLTFLLGGLGLVSILHTYRNLRGLAIRPGHADPVFAGTRARFAFHLDNAGQPARYDIAFSTNDGGECVADVPGGGQARIELAVPAPRRGRLRPGRLRIESRFPIGLFHAWSWIEPEVSCLVYPQPEPTATLPPPRHEEQHGAALAGEGNDDFAGLRAYQPGDSLRHIDWKALARGHKLLTKQFHGEAGASLWLAWDQTAGLAPEARLSRLCRWVLDAETRGLSYGLELPDLVLSPSRGDSHRSRCLEALALYGVAPEERSE